MNLNINVTDRSMANLTCRPCQRETDITTYYFIVTFSTGFSIIIENKSEVTVTSESCWGLVTLLLTSRGSSCTGIEN